MEVAPDAELLPLSRIRVEFGAVFGYVKYLVSELGSLETWGDTLSQLQAAAADVRTQIDAAVAEAKRDMFSADEVRETIEAKVAEVKATTLTPNMLQEMLDNAMTSALEQFSQSQEQEDFVLRLPPTKTVSTSFVDFLLSRPDPKP